MWKYEFNLIFSLRAELGLEGLKNAPLAALWSTTSLACDGKDNFGWKLFLKNKN